MTPNTRITLLITAVAALCCLLLGCGTTGHVGVMHDFGGDADTLGQNPACTLEVRKAVADRISAKYLHQSWCLTGRPFNDKPESTIDAVGVELQIW